MFLELYKKCQAFHMGSQPSEAVEGSFHTFPTYTLKMNLSLLLNTTQSLLECIA